MAKSTGIGSQTTNTKLIAAVGNRVENLIWCFAGTESFHPTDLEYVIVAHVANDENRSRRASTAPIDASDQCVATCALCSFHSHGTIGATRLQLLPRNDVIASRSRQPKDLILEPRQVIGTLPIKDVVVVEPRDHGMTNAKPFTPPGIR